MFKKYEKLIAFFVGGLLAVSFAYFGYTLNRSDNFGYQSSDGLEINNVGYEDFNNSTTTTLLADQTFIGSATDVADYSAISIQVFSDVASAEDGLMVQYSFDRITWHPGETYTVNASTTKFFTPPVQGKFMRVLYTNSGTDQTVFHLHTMIKKSSMKWSSHNIDESIAEEDDAELVKAVLTGEDPNGIFTNVKTDLQGTLRTSLRDGETGRRAEVESLGSLKTIQPTRLVGTTFSNGNKDTNFWTETASGSGSVVQSGEIVLSTGTTSDSFVSYETVRKARKVTGTTNQFRAVARNRETPTADCIRRIGPYDSNNGFFMQFNGESFDVGSRKNGIDIVVTNGSFNGNAGTTINFGGGTDFTRIIIEYTALSAKFFINGILIHTISATSTSLTNTLNLPVKMEVINENGNTINNSYEILFATILRLGDIETESEYKFINTNTTTICKYNSGRLKRILNVDNAGSVTIYDNTAASGDVIATIDSAKALGTLDFDIPFSDGLTVVTSGNSKIVVVYE